MSRAYLIYILMFAVMIGGLWVILTLGAAMPAPDDLAGDWTVAWEGSPGANEPMHVAQSGRFFVVKLGQRPPMSFKLERGWKGSRDGRTLQMSLAGEGCKMNLAGDIPLGDTWQVRQVKVELDGPSRQVGIARRSGYLGPATHPAGVARAR